MDNQEYGPPPSGEPIGYGTPPPYPYPAGVASPSAYPPAFPPPYPPAYASPLQSTREDRNWMGTTSLVLGLMGGGILGAVFGALGISAANEGRASNKKTAVWGLVLNLTMPVLVVGGFLVMGLAAGGLSDDRVDYADLAVGECVQEPLGWNDAGRELPSRNVTRIPCSEPHWGQVYHRARLAFGAYPGDDGVEAAAAEECYSDAAMGNILDAHFDDAYVTYLTPTEETWRAADRSVVCLTFDRDHTADDSWVVGS